MRPNAAAVSDTICAQSAATDTSACNAIAAPPSFSTIATVSCAPSSFTSITAIDAPCDANSTAAACPCPDAAPVISATRPSSISRVSTEQNGQRRRRAEALAVDVRGVALARVGIESQVRESIEQRVHGPAHLHAGEVHAQAHVRADAEADVRND